MAGGLCPLGIDYSANGGTCYEVCALQSREQQEQWGGMVTYFSTQSPANRKCESAGPTQLLMDGWRLGSLGLGCLCLAPGQENVFQCRTRKLPLLTVPGEA